MREFFDTITRSPIFGGVSADETEALLKCLEAKPSEYEKGSYILRSGDSTGSVGLVLKGRVMIVQEDFWGNRNLMAGIAPGQIFAESYACTPGSVLNVSAVADSPCAVLWLDVKRVLTTCPSGCAHHNKMIRNLLSEIAGKNLRMSEKLSHMGKRTTKEKLLSYLSAEAIKNGKGEFDIPFSRQQLADYLTVERSAMSAELGKLRDEGLIEFDKNHFVLHMTD